MTLTLGMPEDKNELKPRITVFGVGGAGGNAVDNMISKNLEGAEFVVANTDLPNVAVAHFVTSPMAHARITAIDTVTTARPPALAISQNATLRGSGCVVSR